MSADPVLEDLMSQLGEIGPYQLKQNLIQNLGAFLGAVHMYSLSVVVPTPAHRCMIPQIDSDLNGTSPSFNFSLLQDFIPLTPDGELDQCHKYLSEFDHRNKSTCNEAYVYNDTYYHSSRVIDMNLVCDKRWVRAILQSIYIFGVLAAAIILGPMADKYGRKKIFCISGILQLLAGLTCAFVGNIYAYAGVLFFYGMFGSGGADFAGFILSMEVVGPSKRALFGTASSLAYSFGEMLVALWAVLISDAWLLQTILALHSVILLCGCWFVDESIRWLWGQGRVEEAVEITKNAVQSNGKQFINRYDGKGPSPKGKGESPGVTDLFKTPAIRCRMVIVTFLWMADSLVYWGLSLNTGELVGNPFLMLFLSGLVEVPAFLLVLLLMDRAGRRTLCSTLFFIGGVACISSTFVHKGDVVGTILVMIGKFAITGTFTITYNYTAELFPTVVRASAVGVGLMGARITGALTPFVALLISLDMRIPIVIFGVTAITAAFLTLLLPETANKEMPQTLEDGELFGKGDTGYGVLVKLLSIGARKTTGIGENTSSDT